jgi:thiol-disulfide isomerase/thioredoxin
MAPLAASKPLLSGLTLLAAVALCAVVVAAAEAQAPYFSRSDLQGAVDAFDATDLDGRRWTSDALQGRVVLIDFWASWCAPCLEQMPHLRRLRETHGSDKFEIVAVSLDRSNRREIVSWIQRQRLDWPQIHDGRAFNGSTARLFGVSALPASLLLNRDGMVVAANLRGPALERALAQLLLP